MTQLPEPLSHQPGGSDRSSRSPGNSTDELLGGRGLFKLDLVARLLKIKAISIKRRHNRMENKGLNPWEIMGVRCLWRIWFVKMDVFGPYYRAHCELKLRPISPRTTVLGLLNRHEHYRLSDVSPILGLDEKALIDHLEEIGNGRQSCGVWLDRILQIHIVNMDVFAPWYHRVNAGQTFQQPEKQAS